MPLLREGIRRMYRSARQSWPTGRNSGESSDGSTWAHPEIPTNHSQTTVSHRRTGQNPERTDRSVQGLFERSDKRESVDQKRSAVSLFTSPAFHPESSFQTRGCQIVQNRFRLIFIQMDSNGGIAYVTDMCSHEDRHEHMGPVSTTSFFKPRISSPGLVSLHDCATRETGSGRGDGHRFAEDR